MLYKIASQRWFYFLIGMLICFQSNAQVLPYKDYRLSVEDRVKDLLSRMTEEEKFYQVFMVAHNGEFNSNDYKNGIFGIQLHAGGLNENAGQQMLDYSNGKLLEAELAEMRSIQEYLVTQTRLGIPAASFNKNVIHDVAEASALARVLRVKFELG